MTASLSFGAVRFEKGREMYHVAYLCDSGLCADAAFQRLTCVRSLAAGISQCRDSGQSSPSAKSREVSDWWFRV